MDFWTFIEKCGEFVIGFFAIIGGGSLIFSGFGEWVQGKFGEMKNWPKFLKAIIGTAIIVLSGLWFTAIIKVEIKRGKEDS
jgi:hypothetical protein